MLKVMTILGTRPEIIRLSRVMVKLDQHFKHWMVHTGQNYDYELNQVFFDEMSIRPPDRFLNAAGSTPAETIGRVICAADQVIAEYEPDAVLILGDTNSSLAAIAAKRRKVPIFHMEAGNRCFDMRVPEEINRRIVDHTADINLTYTQIAREYLLREGLPPDQVICIGSPMREVLEFYRPSIDASKILELLGLERYKYFLLSAHREENVDDPERLSQLLELIGGLATSYKLPVVVSTHPRTRKRLEGLPELKEPLVRFLKPFGFPDYVSLQTGARAVLSDSGTITEESSILNFPAVNLREAHERPEGFEEGAVMFTGMSWQTVQLALHVLTKQERGSVRTIDLVSDYGPDNVSEKVLRIVASYTGFVNRRTWRKF